MDLRLCLHGLLRRRQVGATAVDVVVCIFEFEIVSTSAEIVCYLFCKSSWLSVWM